MTHFEALVYHRAERVRLSVCSSEHHPAVRHIKSIAFEMSFTEVHRLHLGLLFIKDHLPP